MAPSTSAVNTGRKNRRNPHLTSVMATVLRKMRADRDAMDGFGGYLTNDKRVWMVGVDRVSGTAGLQLLHLCAIRRCDFGSGSIYYEIGSEGEHLLDNPDYVPALLAMRQKGARSVVLDPDGTQRF